MRVPIPENVPRARAEFLSFFKQRWFCHVALCTCEAGAKTWQAKVSIVSVVHMLALLRRYANCLSKSGFASQSSDPCLTSFKASYAVIYASAAGMLRHRSAQQLLINELLLAHLTT